MNPLNLPGPTFLWLYVLLFLAACALGLSVRRQLRETGEEHYGKTRELKPFDIAYLQGGKDLAVSAAIAKLVHDGVLACDSSDRTLSCRKKDLPRGATDMERAIYSAVKKADGLPISKIREAAERPLTSIRQRLESWGLVLDSSRAAAASFVPLVLVLMVPVLGVLKIVVGVQRDKPVVYLIVLCTVSTLLSLIVFARSAHRSRLGDQRLAELKSTNTALQTQATHRSDALAGDDLVMAMGLFGLGVLAGGPLESLRQTLAPPAHTGSTGGGCGGGDGGGDSGCGGGGCGGCGGCGGD